MMTLRLFNSLTKDKEIFTPLDPEGKRVTFYNCGPTVYGPFHIGNARNFVVVDVVRRWLEVKGYDVFFVQNITDIDDKIINRAIEENTTPEEIARKYTELFFEHHRVLGNKPAHAYPKATEHVESMISMINTLVEKGHAYPTEDHSVWYHVNSFKEYGKLSRKPLDQMKQGERLDEGQQSLKRSPLDFALWKGSKAGEPAWDSPWGPGRPGWHIECSCMSISVLGSETIDIHSGGVDLQFPHHENEIAQSEAATGKPFVRYWLHNGFLNIDDQKMSKSLGNVLTMDAVLKKINPLTIRYFLFSAHYRTEMDLTDNSLQAAKSATERIVNASREARRFLEENPVETPMDWKADDVLLKHWEDFSAAMDDDINTARALVAVHAVVGELNQALTESLPDEEKAVKVHQRLSLLMELREILGIGHEMEALEGKLEGLEEQLIELLIDVRAEARQQKSWTLSDMVRDRLAEMGVVLQDKPGGKTIWQKQ